ncbi:MAG: NAD(+) synthase [Treponema sp.]|nr:NAD(+) synthase [Treponema sp.]
MSYGFIRVAACSPELFLADCDKNAEKIIESSKEAFNNGASIIVFPELALTGYTCGDLFFQQSLLKSAEENLIKIIDSIPSEALVFLGLPLALGQGIYNCAAVILHKKLLALVPKTYLPNYGEFYERRQFLPFNPKQDSFNISFAGFERVYFGSNILFQDNKEKDLVLACEICEDLWVPLSPSVNHILNGATLIANLSAGNEIIGKADYRRTLIKAHSAKNICAYIYASAGNGESSQDMIFAGHNLIAENGSLLSQSELFSNSTIYADIDYERLGQERRKTTSFGYSVNNIEKENFYFVKEISLSSSIKEDLPLIRKIDPHPFVPSNQNEREERCLEVITLQAQGLAKRLRHIHCQSAVVGLSGGLDSTLALLVTCKAFDLCKVERNKITAITMPCFGTTDRTYNNACKLAKECGVTLKEVRIADSVNQHFKDIGQDPENHDVTYENCQARERTQVLMDYANKSNGIVIGTGDLSELALGWCTYNGDHMSMYGVNSSVPKTLVRYLVDWFAQKYDSDVLRDILATPVSPELLPPSQGQISQVTEDLVGPYELHDFFLYYLLRFSFSPSKIYYLAKNAGFSYQDEFIKKWLKNFYKRFFSQQFKRSCMPDGAKVGTINLSPRGDWRMPSDASAAIWLKEIESL